MAFYTMLISVGLPVILQINRPYTTIMDSLYLAFSQNILNMVKYWGTSIAEPFKYLAGEKQCRYYLLGEWKDTECHILFF